MKKGILLAAIMLMGVAGLAQAQPASNDLGVTLDVTYMSRYIWRGMDIYANDHSAIQPKLTIDWYGTGFGTSVFHSRANSSGFENNQEYDYTLFYNGSLAAEEDYATNYTVGWTYYDYVDPADAQEAFVALSWPKICPAGVVPSYTVVKMWPARSQEAQEVYTDSGFAHIFGLGYDWRGVIPNMPEQALHLSADAVYNDGVGGGTSGVGNVEHDWSHAVFGVSSAFPIAENLKFTPGVYYQSSWEDSVNKSDEYWTTLTMSYTF